MWAIEKFPLRNDAVFPPLLWTGKWCKTPKLGCPLIVYTDLDRSFCKAIEKMQLRRWAPLAADAVIGEREASATPSV
jgi:hypothetical protein